MGEVADFLYKLTPLILGVCALLIPSAAERLKGRQPPATPTPPVDVIQGQTVDLTGDRVRALENDLRQEGEIARLQRLLIRNGIDYEEGAEGNGPAANRESAG